MSFQAANSQAKSVDSPIESVSTARDDKPCGDCFGDIASKMGWGNTASVTDEDKESDAMRRARKTKLDAKNGTLPSPAKNSSISHTIAPFTLQKTPDMYIRSPENDITAEEAKIIKDASVNNPGVLVGYQIADRSLTEKSVSAETGEIVALPKLYVITGIRSARLFSTEFCLSSVNSNGVEVESWEKLNRKKSGGRDFTIKRRVLNLPKA